MKKVLVLAVLAVFVMMPLASFAKTAISDSELSSVTAQEGVSIDLSGLIISDVGITVNATGDGDGWGTAGGNTANTSAGWSGSTISLFTVNTSESLIKFGTGALEIDCGSTGAVTKTRISLPAGGIMVGGTSGLTVVQINKLSSVRELTGGTTQGTTYMSGVKATLKGSVIMYAH